MLLCVCAWVVRQHIHMHGVVTVADLYTCSAVEREITNSYHSLNNEQLPQFYTNEGMIVCTGLLLKYNWLIGNGI